MSAINRNRQAEALRLLAESLEIPKSHYEKARERYRSLGEWLERDASTLAHLSPRVYPQGSFRYGTVIPSNEGFDLDLVCELGDLAKRDQPQQWVKMAVGAEVLLYARAKAMKSDPEPKRRCWHLEYADDIHFHMDILPAIPEDEDIKEAIAEAIDDARGLPRLAAFAIAITDEKHPAYSRIDREWPMSNPRGYAKWFESRMRPTVERLLKASARKIEDVPVYEWKTTLQTAIQILKQHRNTMFADNPMLRPISVIITTLSAEAYEGQTDLRETLQVIVDRIPGLVRPAKPRIPNPVNPGEDFADKWAEKPELEDAFWDWHGQLRRDLDRLGDDLETADLRRHLDKRFNIRLPRDQVARVVPAVAVTAPSVRVTSRPRPWGSRG